MKFKDWANGYKKEYEEALKEWQETNGVKVIIPEGIDDKLLQQYVAYKNVMETKRLVFATWALAIVGILTLLVK